MRMPIFAYFAVVGTCLFVLLVLSSRELPSVDLPIKTSQLVGLPKTETQPDTQPLMTTFNFAAERESAPAKPNTASEISQASANTRKSARGRLGEEQPANKEVSAPGEHRGFAEYPHDTLMRIH